ncbi:MAG: transglutaminase family protein [Syntrophales bacterium]|nr:transglutaminase family protein [Syntrophales bacterium]
MTTTLAEQMDIFLRPTAFIDSDSEEVQAFAGKSAGAAAGPIDKAVKLFYAVRDEIRYDPYQIELTSEGLRAGATLRRGYGYCVAKAVVLAAAARALGIPSRLGFADVRNHLSTERLRQLMKTDLFTFHGYTELFLDNRWVKATPTFNLSLCQRFGVKPLDFDGRNDALLHSYDAHGNRHMEYVHDHGAFPDLPLETIIASFRKHYPFFFDQIGTVAGDFEREAQAEKKA